MGEFYSEVCIGRIVLLPELFEKTGIIYSVSFDIQSLLDGIVVLHFLDQSQSDIKGLRSMK